MTRTRATAPVATGSAADFVPPNPTLPKLKEAARKCRGCHLWLNATQTVFGEGSPHAEVMFVGEQPGDQEDRLGHPFVGPAGKLLDTALEQAGIDRRRVYVTNTVKHFKFVVIERGRRLHKKPAPAEVRACKPWLLEEIHVMKPTVIVALGATAAQALLGKDFRVTQHRGEPIASDLAEAVIATVHPSAVLRAPAGERERAREEFFEDMKKVAVHLRTNNEKWPARGEASRPPSVRLSGESVTSRASGRSPRRDPSGPARRRTPRAHPRPGS